MLEKERKINIKNKILTIREIRIDEVDKCLQLQSTLTEKEAKVFGIRSKEKYQTLIKKGIMLGLYDQNNNLIGQIATSLSTEKSSYVASKNKIISDLLDSSAVIEQGAYIIRKDYRGHSLESELEVDLLKRLKVLVKNEKLLKKKNEKLAEMIKNNKSVLLVSGCSSKNPASALTSLKNGSMLINSDPTTVVNLGDKPITSYTLMKVVLPRTKLIKHKFHYIDLEKKKLLKEREIESIKDKTIHGRNNPLPEKWVNKVMKSGYVVTRKNNKYNIEKPIGMMLQ